SRRRHTRFSRDWSSDVCSSDFLQQLNLREERGIDHLGLAAKTLPFLVVGDLSKNTHPRTKISFRSKNLVLLRRVVQVRLRTLEHLGPSLPESLVRVVPGLGSIEPLTDYS